MKDVQQVQLRLPVDVHQWLKAEGQRQDRSVNWLIAKVLAEAKAKCDEAKEVARA
jgi:predicted HicB family RNase H-like nuclease